MYVERSCSHLGNVIDIESITTLWKGNRIPSLSPSPRFVIYDEACRVMDIEMHGHED